jgi:hypothetical protein
VAFGDEERRTGRQVDRHRGRESGLGGRTQRTDRIVELVRRVLEIGQVELSD